MTVNKDRTRALLAAVVLAVVGVVGQVAAASAGPPPPLLLNHEHVDALSLGYEGGELSMQAAADLESGNGQLFDPSEVLLQLEDIPAGVFVDDVVHLHLRDVRGPGHVEVFMEDSGGQPIRIFSSTEPTLRSHTTSVGSHAHTNWTFDALGTYTLTFEATATTVEGVELSTGPVDYRWLVGSLPTATEPTVPDSVTTGDPDPDPAPDPPGDCAIEAVLDVGHVDVAARIVDGELVSQVKDTTQDGPPVWRDLATVAFHAKPEARTQVPAEGGYEFIGPAGSGVWVLPQVQDPNLLWPGWNTEEIDYSQLVSGVAWSLDAVEGPGDLAVFQVGDFGVPNVLFDSSDPLPQSLALDIRTHAHGNWAFDTEGIYRLTFHHTARLSSGAELRSEGTLAVAVGQVNLDDLCPGRGVPDPSGPGDPGSSESPPAPAQPAAVPCPVPQRSASSQDGDAVVLAAGHVDYAAQMAGGDLVSQVKDGTVAGRTEWRDPSQVVFHVKPEARTQVPAGAQFGFLGSPGAPIWQIPQTQDPALLWLGWNTEALPADQVAGPVTWTLDAMEGPGDLAVYTLGSFGQPTVIFSSGDGAGDVYQVPLGTHAHGNWAFTAEGTYRVTFTHRARLASGETASDTATVTFAVGTRQATTTTVTSGVSSPTGDCRLPSTGTDIDGMLLAGGMLIGAGSALSLSAQRRRGRG